MEEVIRNIEGNDSFFYIFMVVLVILAIGNIFFKKNLSLLFSNDFEIYAENSLLLIFCVILLFAFSGGLFFNSVFQKFHFEWILKITESQLINNVLIACIFCFSLIFIRFLWAQIAYFVLGIRFTIIFYFLLQLRYILPASFLLILTAILVKYMNVSELQMVYLIISVMSILLLGFLIFLFNRLIYLNRNTNIPLYYIILYLCALEILPMLVIGKILIISAKP